MGKFLDITGHRFGRLCVVSRGPNNKWNKAQWHCECDCGRSVLVVSSDLRSGHTQSCGCIRLEMQTTHGLSDDPAYQTWFSMLARCYNESVPGYKNYGGRGITVCKDWRDGPEAFIKWAHENGFCAELTLDRKDNDKGYSPDNCRFSTKTEQNRNKRTAKVVTYRGEEVSLSSLCREFGKNYNTVKDRLKRGLSIHEALTTEVVR